MPTTLELVLDLAQLRPHPIRDGDTPQPEPPVPGLPAHVRKAEEVERFRLTLTPRRPVLGGEPPELDQPGLVRVQLQPEPREPLAKLVQEPPRILLMFEPDGVVVSEPHNDDVPVRPPFPPPVRPQVEHVVQIEV